MHEILLNLIKNSVTNRNENPLYRDMFSTFNQKKYQQKLIRLEEFIDDCYANENFQFKYSIQTNKSLNNLVDDFFTFRYYLVN